MKKLIGLIGATAPTFFVQKLRPIIAKHGYAWYGWTIPIRRKTLAILKRQIDYPEIGHFNLYGYSSSWPEGSYSEATHKVEAIFVVKKILTHLDTAKDFNSCPEPDKGIIGEEYGDYYTKDRESGHGRDSTIELPRKTWFAIEGVQEKTIDLNNRNFIPWNPLHRIHPSPLRANFIDIVDTLDL